MNANTATAQIRSERRVARAVPYRIVLPHVMPQRRQAAASTLARTLRLDHSRVLEEMPCNAFYMRRGLSQSSAAAVVDALKALQIPAYAEPDSITQLGRRAALSESAQAPSSNWRTESDHAPKVVDCGPSPYRATARQWPVLRRSGTRYALISAVGAATIGMLFADLLLSMSSISAFDRAQVMWWSASAAVFYVLPSLIAMCFRLDGWRAVLPINFFVGITGLGWAVLLRHVVAGIRSNEIEQPI